jgi:hypothetical protein
MIQFRYVEIHVRGCGSSRDLEVKATSGRAAAICRLKSGSVFPIVYADIGDRS